MIRARALTAEAFAPYGQVVEHAAQGRWINGGAAWRSEAGAPALDGAGGRAALAVFRARGQGAAGPWQAMERHRLGSQTFLPLTGAPCLVLVALGASAPAPDTLAAFVTRAGQGWTLAPGTWHHALIALADADVAVLERQAGTVDCEEAQLPAPVTVVLAPPAP